MEAHPEAEVEAEPESKPNGNLALTLVVFSWCAWMLFQSVQLLRERNHLTQLKTNQESALHETAKMKAQIDSIAGDTAKLAATGNPRAQRIVAELKRRGFKIDLDMSTPAK